MSVVEIAAQVGLSEKRMRAVIREILARRMPHPPEQFVAIQLSRLNEALLVAYSAMSLTNLKAVDQVVKIVRELDRYHGCVAAERRLPEAPRSEALVDGAATYGAALVCQARYEPQGFGDIAFDSVELFLAEGRLGASGGDERPEHPPQTLEMVESAPGRLAVETHPAPCPNRLPVNEEKGRPGASSGDERPENPPQTLEMVESAPGPLAPRSPGQEPRDEEGWPLDLMREEAPGRLAAETHPAPRPNRLRMNEEKGRLGASAGDERPKNQPQSLEMVESAPGPRAPRSPGQEAGEGEGWPSDLIRGDGPGRLAAVGAGEQRPEIPLQTPETIDSAPEIGQPAESAPAPCQAAFDGPMILTRTGWKPATMRMLQNGVAA